ncbi:hypothetical protein HBB16_01205 [Pseudonocardia sp. MCCB 268]|nr:hypothetical protein [Pseudonocardia cytotoxica]
MAGALCGGRRRPAPELRIAGGAVAGKVDALEMPVGESFVGCCSSACAGMAARKLMIGLASTVAGFCAAQPALDRGRPAVRGEDAWDEKWLAAPLRRQERRPPAHRRGDLPGRQGLLGQPAADPAGAARPLHRPRRRSSPEALKESVSAAQTAVKDDAVRQKRVADLEAEPKRVEALAERARKLAAAVETAEGSSALTEQTRALLDALAVYGDSRRPAGCATTWTGSTSRCGSRSPAR